MKLYHLLFLSAFLVSIDTKVDASASIIHANLLAKLAPSIIELLRDNSPILKNKSSTPDNVHRDLDPILKEKFDKVREIPGMGIVKSRNLIKKGSLTSEKITDICKNNYSYTTCYYDTLNLYNINTIASCYESIHKEHKNNPIIKKLFDTKKNAVHLVKSYNDIGERLNNNNLSYVDVIICCFTERPYGGGGLSTFFADDVYNYLKKNEENSMFIGTTYADFVEAKYYHLLRVNKNNDNNHNRDISKREYYNAYLLAQYIPEHHFSTIYSRIKDPAVLSYLLDSEFDLNCNKFNLDFFLKNILLSVD